MKPFARIILVSSLALTAVMALMPGEAFAFLSERELRTAFF